MAQERSRARQPGVSNAMADDRLQLMFDHETGSTLRLALLVVGVASLGYLPAYLSGGAKAEPRLALVAGAMGLAFLCAWLWTRHRPLVARFNHAAYSLVIFLTASNAALSQATVGGAEWSTNMTIIIIGAGMCIVGWRWSLATGLASIAMWVALVGPEFGSTGSGTSVTNIAFTLLAAGIINTGRRKSIARLLRVTEESERAAVIDSLTQVYNRRGLALVAAQLVRTAKRTGEPVGVLVLDVDRFKSINDQLGHQVGDQALVAVAEALRSGGRDSDIVARWGGDEFVVVTLGNAPEAGELAERVELALAKRGVTEAGGGRVQVSVGVANIESIAEPDDIDRLISDADAAMYAGRARRRARPFLVVSNETPQNLSTGR